MLKQKCPSCGFRRLLEGPFYDPDNICCLECGKRFRPRRKKK